MKKFFSLAILLSLLLLTSCQSIALVLRSGFGGVPVWVNKRPQAEGMAYFVGRGIGETLSQAKGEAINNVLEEISAVVGIDITGRYFSQMMAYEYVEDAGISIEADYYRRDIDSNMYNYYVLAIASEENLSKIRAPEFQNVLERERRIASLLEMAKESYKTNNDVQAVIYCLEAVEVSARGRMDKEEYQYPALIKMATEYLSRIKIRLSEQRPEKGTVRVTLLRRKGFFSPGIVNADVSARFPISSYEGKTFVLPFKTGDDGSFVFRKNYSPMANEGTVVFYLDFSSLIDRAVKYIDESEFEEFLSVNENIREEFSYSKTSYISDGELIISIGEFDAKGRLLESTYAQDAIKAYFVNEGIVSESTRLESETEEELLEEVKQHFPDAKYLIWGKVGFDDVYSAPTGNKIRTAEGRAYFYRLSDGSLILSDDHIRSLTWVDEENAAEALFTSYGKDLATNITNYL